MQNLLTSLRAAAVTVLLCCVGYFALVWAFANAVVPARAQGSLVERDGIVVGSSQVAQAFASPRYLWPRPSAVDYDAAGAGGSNLSPTSPLIRERAESVVAAHNVAGPLPADLVTASGSGLDPHVTLAAALAQAPRVAAARGRPAADVERVIRDNAASASGLPSDDLLVNVLMTNLALDERPR